MVGASTRVALSEGGLGTTARSISHALGVRLPRFPFPAAVLCPPTPLLPPTPIPRDVGRRTGLRAVHALVAHRSELVGDEHSNLEAGGVGVELLLCGCEDHLPALRLEPLHKVHQPVAAIPAPAAQAPA